ncbi:MAG: hypothetical protein RL172_2558 [Bacteroidota bacterium]|jgi:hypothetical protein
MIKKQLYTFITMAAIVCCLPACKKSKSDTIVPVPDDAVTYELSTAIFPNPERGFIHTYPVFSEGASLNASLLATLRSQNVSMVLRLFYLDAFKDKALSQAQLTLIQTDLDKIRTAGIKAILRFAYTDDMAGADAPLAIIQQHLDQLQPIFNSNQDVIAFVQAGFIGAWGEWHSSSNGLATTSNQRAVLNKLLSVLPAAIMVQVRTPGYKQAIFNTTTPVDAAVAYTAEASARVGHHNDCFLTGGTDYGTYNNVAAEKQYISTEAAFVPTGGETCPPSAGYDPSCNEGRNEMKLLKWTYLNLDWYGPTIAAWKSAGCYNEFQTNLGYRLALVSTKMDKQATVNGSIAINIQIANKGYAPLYHQKNTYLVFKNKATGAYYEKELTADLRLCKPAANLTISQNVSLGSLPAGEYAIYLRVADKAPTLKNRIEYAVQFANTGVWVEENAGMNYLKQTLTIK